MIDETYEAYSAGAATQSTVTAFFDTRAEADAAADRLRALGISGRVSVTEGAGGSGVTDASAGGTTDDRGFFERLGDFFFPEEDRSTYAEGLSRGGYLVTVTGLAAGDYDVAMDALEDAGAVDIDERAESWRAEGWTGGSSGMAGQTGLAGGMSGGMSDSLSGTSSGSSSGSAWAGGSASGTALGSGDSDETLPVVEERLRVAKRDVSHGRVRVRSYVVEEPVSETVHLEAETVDVERRPVDRPLGREDGDLFRERSIEAEEFREEAVVSKEARIVEEVGLRRSHDSRDETISDTVRRTEVEVEDDRGTASGLGSGADRTSGMTEYEAETGRPGIDDDEDDDDATGLTNRNLP